MLAPDVISHVVGGSRAGARVRLLAAAWLGILTWAVPCPAGETNQEAYAAALKDYLAHQDQVRNNELAQIQSASDRERRNAFESALTEHLQTLVEPVKHAVIPVAEHTHLTWALVAALTLVLGLRVPAPRLVACLLRRFDPWTPAAAGAAGSALAPHLLAEDPAWTGFMRAMEEGLKSVAKDAAKPASGQAKDDLGVAHDPSRFYESAPKQLTHLRTLFTEFSRGQEAPKTSAKVLELLREVQAFKESAAAPALLPVRQLTAALIGLLTQLSKQPANLTPSTLRTLAAGLDLLKDLCVRGVRPNLVSEPPVRLLAVDDEPLTRGLVSRALQKVFGAPDMAAGGEDALNLVAKQAYDLILLDVEMPGMDGFELCQKLHGAALNAATPVVFVTRHSDFQARAKSTLHGAQDLIAKPFLAFELALKALTLILRTRLAGRPSAAQAARAAATPPPVASAAENTPAPVAPTQPAEAVPAVATTSASAPTAEPAAAAKAAPQPAPALAPATAAKPAAPARPAVSAAPPLSAAAKALFAQTAAPFRTFHDQLGLVRSSAKPEEINALLAKFYPGVASFCSEAYAAKLNAGFRLGSALEAMLKKLLERPKLRPPSTFESVALALEVLAELAQSGKDIDLDEVPPHLLVVDDDLLARRMMGEALQVAFGRPEGAESGETALALAKAKPFDLIYMDVLMPGLDGFATCAEIRQTELNRDTPVVFVTSQSDGESRARGGASGGSGFIVKPTLPCEITLVTVSLLLRHRLAQQAVAAPATPEAAPEADNAAPARVLSPKQRRRQTARQRRQESTELVVKD